MARYVVLDTSPAWLAAGPRGKPLADSCRAWLDALDAAGVQFILPEIADFEVRRELILRGASSSLRRLDGLKVQLDFHPITSAAMLQAAEVWADVRRRGKPTAGDALEADAILAGQAMVAGQLGDTVTIATTNVRHLTRFPGIDAQEWAAII